MVTYFRDQLSNIIGDGIDLLFCNEQEAITWTGQTSIEGALSSLSDTAVQWVCTRGKDGASVFDGRSQFDLPGREVTPVDTNGAGDMFAGAFFIWTLKWVGIRAVSILRRLCFRILNYTIRPCVSKLKIMPDY